MGNAKQIHTSAGIPGFGPVVSGVQKATNHGWLASALGAAGGAFLNPAGTILGTLASAGLNFGLNRIETGIQNRYNAPKAVMHRLSQAGIPGAAYFQGGGNQSASSSQQYAQPDLGTAEAISREQTNRFQKHQFALMEREMALKEAQQRLAEANAYKSEIWGDYMGRDSSSPQVLNNFGKMIDIKNRLTQSQDFLIKNKGIMQQIDNALSYKLFGTKVDQAKANLAVTREKIPLMKIQQAVGDQQVQESISRVAKNIVSMEAMKTQMSVADQTVRIRQLNEKLNQVIYDQVTKSGISDVKAAILQLILGGHLKPF